MSQISPQQLQYQKAHIRDDLRSLLLVACAVCWPVACVTVLLRLLARRLTRLPLQADDYMIVVALVRARLSRYLGVPSGAD